MNSLKYIRDTYKVPAFRGARISYAASDGDFVKAIIVGGKNGRLRARIENNDGSLQRKPSLFHPVWHITYEPSKAALAEAPKIEGGAA